MKCLAEEHFNLHLNDEYIDEMKHEGVLCWNERVDIRNIRNTDDSGFWFKSSDIGLMVFTIKFESYRYKQNKERVLEIIFKTGF